MVIPVIATVLALLTLAGLHGPAGANSINETYLGYSTPYAPAATAEYLRINIEDTRAAKKFESSTIDRKQSQMTITRTVAGKVVLFTAPVDQAASQQLAQGKLAAKPGFIDFRPVGTTFMPGDLVSFRLFFDGQVNYRTLGGLWRDGDGKAGVNSTVAGVRLQGAAGFFDPAYLVSDDLDTSVFLSPAAFQVRNLTFLANLDTASLLAIDLAAVAGGSLPSGSPPAAPFDLQSSQASSGALPSSRTFLDPWPEPDAFLWNVAVGQLFDESADILSAFANGYRAIPAPATALLLGSGLVILAVGGVVRRSRRHRA